MIAIVDAGPLYASIDRSDRWHARSVAALHQPGMRLFIPILVIAEVAYLVGRRLGPAVEAQFLGDFGSAEIAAPTADDWPRIAELVRQYADLPLGVTDASVVALAERLGTDTFVTLDRRHFSVVRPRHVAAWRLLPEA